MENFTGEHDANFVPVPDRSTIPVGVVTEASPLTPPPSSLYDEEPYDEELESALQASSSNTRTATVDKLDTAPLSTPERGVRSSVALDEQDTAPVPVEVSPDGPLATSLPDQAEQALFKLNDAARRIAAEEPFLQGGQRPRASRLTPFYDVSSDIHRDSTPMPSTVYNTQPSNDYNTQPSFRSFRSFPLPDIRNWALFERDEDSDSLAGIDPLQARRLPGSVESERVENPSARKPRRVRLPLGRKVANTTLRLPIPMVIPGRWRLVFVSLTLMAVLALSLDVVLVWIAFKNPPTLPQLPTKNTPTLVLENSTVQYGQQLKIYIRNFTPNSTVSLTRDIDVPIQKTADSALLQVDKDGSKDVVITINSDWEPGMHSVLAEDTKTRFTANATLRVDAGPTRPPSLVVSNTDLDLGAGYEGANTVQPLTLHDGGSGVVSWSATSDQPWLTVSPARGNFSDGTQLSVGGSRVGLTPKDYNGTIKITANGGSAQVVKVSMTVRPLPEDSGAVLAVAPASLAFTATDGEDDPASQFVTISNPGNKPLYWNLQNNKPTNQDSSLATGTALNDNWLAPEKTSGTIPAKSQAVLKVFVHSSDLLPGTYTRTLLFGVQNNHEALNAPTPVSVSLTVQQGCGVNLHGDILHFTAIAKRSNPSSQSLNLTASDSCHGTINWKAAKSDKWLNLAPDHGTLSSSAGSVLTVNVDISQLDPGTYPGMISITADHNTHTIMVDLKVQPEPRPSDPLLVAAPLSLNFGATMGQTDTAGQTVTLSNTGGSPVYWSTVVTQMSNNWLGASPTGGSIQPGQTGQLTVNVSAQNLPPASYVGQVEVHGYDSSDHTHEVSGSPQYISVSFIVRPPCTLSSPSSKSLSFTEPDDASTIAPQAVTFSASGSCNWPLTWNATVQTANANWLGVSPVSGSISNTSDPTSLTFSVDRSNLNARSSRRVSILISVTDKNGQDVPGGSQTIQVAIVKACGLQVTPTSLSFEVKQGQAGAAQGLDIGTLGSCKFPASWTASGNDGGENWLGLSATSGSLDGTDDGTLNVSVKPVSLSLGQHSATITLNAQDNAGATVRTITINATLQVDGLTLAGTINACPDAPCTSPPALAGATVTLRDSNNIILSTITADSSGHYSFGNLTLGNYTVIAGGSLAGNNYTTNSPQAVTLSGDATSVAVNTFAPPGVTPTP